MDQDPTEGKTSEPTPAPAGGSESEHGAGGAVETAKEKLDEVKEKLAPKIEEAKEKLGPKIEEAKEKLGPKIEEAKEKLGPKVEEAKEKLGPKVEEASKKVQPTLAKLKGMVSAALIDAVVDLRSVKSGLTNDEVKVAGVASTFPAASVACTAKVWEPSARLEYVAGLVQVVTEPPSSWHLNVDPDSLDVNENEAAASVDGSGGELVIVVSGGVRSICQLKVAGVGSVCAAASVACTENVCSPSVRLV